MRQPFDYETAYDVVVCGGGIARLAAALAAERGLPPDRLPVPELQAELRRRRFLLDVRELGFPVGTGVSPVERRAVADEDEECPAFRELNWLSVTSRRATSPLSYCSLAETLPARRCRTPKTACRLDDPEAAASPGVPAASTPPWYE